jgi:diguanylate cyclase (GGDEF)-like protein
VASPSAPVDDSLLSSIRRHLDGLKGTRDGMVLYNLIERGLKRYGETGQIERAFVNFVTALLGRYAKDPAYDASTRIKARLIQQRLALHLAAPAPPMRPAPTPASEAPAAALEPTPLRAAKPEPAPAPSPAKKAAPPLEPKPAPPPVAAPVPQKHDDAPMEDLEQELVERVAEVISTNGAVAAAPAGEADKTLTEFEDLKGVLVRGLDDLIRERHALIRRIDGATSYLKALEKDRRRLNDELSKARKHSSVDELTGLPLRDIFVRSLEAEVGRVRRYGFSFALALLDVDGMREINDSYGRDTGDAVLRCYASEIFSRFRAYDLVSRYGDDEFAVLFPNTQKDGAMRALEKAQKTAASTYVSHEGRSLRLPSFSSVLTVYSQGEKPAQLLKRAAEALDQARLHGRNQIVVSLPSA